MKNKKNKIEGLETRRSFRLKKKLKKLKESTVLIFVGFAMGIVYSNLFINTYAEEIEPKIEQKEEIKEEVMEESLAIQENISEEIVCILDEISCKIKDSADKYGIDWKMAIAISKHETAEYTSYAFTSLNNVGGLMYWDGTKSALQSFKSLEEGIEKFVSNLKYNYYDMGLYTIEAIQKKYAPVGAANDPNNLNSYWVAGVTKYYNVLGK